MISFNFFRETDGALKVSRKEMTKDQLLVFISSLNTRFGDHRIEGKSIRFEGCWIVFPKLNRGVTKNFTGK